MKWVPREPPKIDRIACLWLVARFVDKAPEFRFGPTEVFAIAEPEGNSIRHPGAEPTPIGERCRFATLLDRYGLEDPALRRLAVIVRGADTDRLSLAPQAASLRAVSLGLSDLPEDDHEPACPQPS